MSIPFCLRGYPWFVRKRVSFCYRNCPCFVSSDLVWCYNHISLSSDRPVWKLVFKRSWNISGFITLPRNKGPDGRIPACFQEGLGFLCSQSPEQLFHTLHTRTHLERLGKSWSQISPRGPLRWRKCGRGLSPTAACALETEEGRNFSTITRVRSRF